MTANPAFCIASDPASMAARLMRDNDVGSIPVAEDRKSRRLVGIVTDRDIALSIVAEDRDPRGTTVGDIMTPNPVTWRPDDDIQAALDAMKKNQLRRIPVVDGKGQLLGIIAQADIAVHGADSAKTAEVVATVSQPA